MDDTKASSKLAGGGGSAMSTATPAPTKPLVLISGSTSLLDDVPIMTIAYDNTLLPKGPVRWNMRRLLLVSGFMGLMAVAQTFGLLLIGMKWINTPDWQSWIQLTQE